VTPPRHALAIGILEALQAAALDDRPRYEALGAAIAALYRDGRVTRRRRMELRTPRGERVVLWRDVIERLEAK